MTTAERKELLGKVDSLIRLRYFDPGSSGDRRHTPASVEYSVPLRHTGRFSGCTRGFDRRGSHAAPSVLIRRSFPHGEQQRRGRALVASVRVDAQMVRRDRSSDQAAYRTFRRGWGMVSRRLACRFEGALCGCGARCPKAPAEREGDYLRAW